MPIPLADSPRPDPESFLTDPEGRARGRLKIYFGAAPGVGKTYAMLLAAQARKADGVDVIAGVVETHGREETASLLKGIPILPRQRIEQRGQLYHEFNLDDALARHPQLILMDELAHTNAPSSRHPKRYQDIEELLAAGIDVYTTLNVQHMESVNDVVAQITKIIVRETVPDSVVMEADEVVLVDLPPAELLERLKEGKVYVPAQAARAMRNFFQQGKLTALRELALRCTAERVDDQMVTYMRRHAIQGPWPVGQRLMACLTADSDPIRLVRATRRFAEAIHAKWLAVYVEQLSHDEMIDPASDAINKALRLAEELGGECHTLSGSSAAREFVHFARNHNITQLVVGEIARSPLSLLLKPSLSQRLLRLESGIAVQVIATSEPENRPSPGHRRRVRDLSNFGRIYDWRSYVYSMLAVVVAGGVAWFFSHFLNLSAISMVFLTAVMFSAVSFGLVPSLLASLLSFILYDYFFMPPLYSIAFFDPEHFFTLMVYLLVASINSDLGDRLRNQSSLERRRQRNTNLLYALCQQLMLTNNEKEYLRILAAKVIELTQAEVLILQEDGGSLRLLDDGLASLTLNETDWAAANWCWNKVEEAGLQTDTLPGAGYNFRPIRGQHGVVGLIGIKPERPSILLQPEWRRLVQQLCTHTAQAIEAQRGMQA